MNTLTVLTVGAAILAGVSTLLAGASLILHAIAPHTKTKLDDDAATRLDTLRKDVDGILALLPPAAPAKKPEAGSVRLTILAALALVAVIACGATQKKALSNLATCSELAAVKDLTPTVENIIASGVGSWQQQLDALGKAFGIDELACAVTAAQQFFAAKLGAGSDAEGPEQRASQWLSEHGYQ